MRVGPHPSVPSLGHRRIRTRRHDAGIPGISQQNLTRRPPGFAELLRRVVSFCRWPLGRLPSNKEKRVKMRLKVFGAHPDRRLYMLAIDRRPAGSRRA